MFTNRRLCADSRNQKAWSTFIPRQSRDLVECLLEPMVLPSFCFPVELIPRLQDIWSQNVALRLMLYFHAPPYQWESKAEGCRSGQTGGKIQRDRSVSMWSTLLTFSFTFTISAHMMSWRLSCDAIWWRLQSVLQRHQDGSTWTYHGWEHRTGSQSDDSESWCVQMKYVLCRSSVRWSDSTNRKS